MIEVLKEIRRVLTQISDPELQESGQRYFKGSVKMYGTKTADVVKLAKDTFRTIKDKPKKELFSLVESLWKSGYMEESFIACEWTYALRKQFVKEDFELFEQWIDLCVTNWASCDTFCNHSMGALIEMYPKLLPRLRHWAQSKNMWLRRASAVSLIVPARKGMFLTEIFTIAEILLMDHEDLVQKGYGWALKVASERHQKEVFAFVMKHKSTMPRTALRYAIEKMPKNLKIQAMK